MSNPMYNEAAFYTEHSSAVTGVTATVNAAPSQDIKVMKDDNGQFLRHVTIDSSNIVATKDTTLDGLTPYAPVGTVEADHGGGTAVQTASDLTESISYSGTLATGTYTRADILSLVGSGATALLSFSATCAAGTMDFDQGGNVENLGIGSIVDRPYAEGLAINDFTLTVDAGGQAYVQARGLA